MRALIVALALTGCVGGVSTSQAPTAEFRLDARGIDVVGTGQRIDFGRAQPGVTQTMTRIRGQAPETLTCLDPGMSALAWNDGLDLVFQNGAFVGWWTNEPARTTNGAVRAGPTCRV